MTLEIKKKEKEKNIYIIKIKIDQRSILILLEKLLLFVNIFNFKNYFEILKKDYCFIVYIILYIICINYLFMENVNVHKENESARFVRQRYLIVQDSVNRRIIHDSTNGGRDGTIHTYVVKSLSSPCALLLHVFCSRSFYLSSMIFPGFSRNYR